MSRLLAIISTAIVIAVGFITLLGLVVAPGEELGILSILVTQGPIHEATSFFVQLVVVTVAVTIIIGLINLFGVHLGRTIGQRRGWPYSLVLLLSTLLVLGLTFMERNGLLSTEPRPSTILLETVQVSIESALAALLLFALVYGAYRMMRRRVTWSGLLFIAVLLIVLIGALPLQGAGVSLFSQVSSWLLAVPVSAGARGILLGIALATIVTGVRILIGQDRSYRE